MIGRQVVENSALLMLYPAALLLMLCLVGPQLCINQVLARLIRQLHLKSLAKSSADFGKYQGSAFAHVHGLCMCTELMHRTGKQLWLPPEAAHVADNAAEPAPARAQPAEGCASA